MEPLTKELILSEIERAWSRDHLDPDDVTTFVNQYVDDYDSNHEEVSAGFEYLETKYYVDYGQELLDEDFDSERTRDTLLWVVDEWDACTITTLVMLHFMDAISGRYSDVDVSDDHNLELRQISIDIL